MTMNSSQNIHKPPHKCPENSVFVRVFSQKASLKEKEELIDHILICRKCRTKFEVLRELKALKPQTRIPEELLEKDLHPKEQKKPLSLPVFKKFSWKTFFAAAALFLAAAACAFFVFFHSPPPVMRGDSPSELVLLEPGNKISQPPQIFIWNELENANGYKFKLVDENLETLFSATLKKREQTVLKLPGAVVNKLESGKTYIWSIKAYDNEENFVAFQSKSFQIR
jgi:hypothetical protein